VEGEPEPQRRRPRGVVDGLLRERDETALAAEVRAPGGA
jgi:hypothetical protein